MSYSCDLLTKQLVCVIANIKSFIYLLNLATKNKLPTFEYFLVFFFFFFFFSILIFFFFLFIYLFYLFILLFILFLFCFLTFFLDIRLYIFFSHLEKVNIAYFLSC